MQKVNKHTALKAARDNGSWSGYAAGNKVNEGNITGGWYLGTRVVYWDRNKLGMAVYSDGE